jgi:hypothetical protein
VGPDLGKRNSVRVTVCTRGEEMLMDVEDGLLRGLALELSALLTEGDNDEPERFR